MPFIALGIPLLLLSTWAAASTPAGSGSSAPHLGFSPELLETLDVELEALCKLFDEGWLDVAVPGEREREREEEEEEEENRQREQKKEGLSREREKTTDRQSYKRAREREIEKK